MATHHPHQAKTTAYAEQPLANNTKKNIHQGCATLHHAKITIQPSPTHRYGVFADELILPEEVIEECPVLLWQKEPAVVSDYSFQWDKKYSALALGCGSLYNHADEPNAKYILNHANDTIKFIATKPIYRGKEIFINYGKEYWEMRENFRENSALYQTTEKRSSITRVVFLSLILAAVYFLTPLSINNHVHARSAAAAVTPNNIVNF